MLRQVPFVKSSPENLSSLHVEALPEGLLLKVGCVINFQTFIHRHIKWVEEGRLEKRTWMGTSIWSFYYVICEWEIHHYGQQIGNGKRSFNFQQKDRDLLWKDGVLLHSMSIGENTFTFGLKGKGVPTGKTWPTYRHNELCRDYGSGIPLHFKQLDKVELATFPGERTRFFLPKYMVVQWAPK